MILPREGGNDAGAWEREREQIKSRNYFRFLTVIVQRESPILREEEERRGMILPREGGNDAGAWEREREGKTRIYHVFKIAFADGGMLVCSGRCVKRISCGSSCGCARLPVWECGIFTGFHPHPQSLPEVPKWAPGQGILASIPLHSQTELCL